MDVWVTLFLVAMLSGYVSGGLLVYRVLCDRLEDRQRANRITLWLFIPAAITFVGIPVLMILSPFAILFAKPSRTAQRSEPDHHQLKTSDIRTRKRKRRHSEPAYATGNSRLSPWSGTRRLSFEYTNQHGETRERVVDAKQIKISHGEPQIIGFCHYRNAIRTFNESGIIGDVVDLDTGEVGSLRDLFYKPS